MSNSSRIAATLILSLALTPLAAMSQSAIHACAAIQSASERLACYDAAFPPASSAVVMASEREQALKDFGLNKSQLRGRDPDRMRVVAPDRIEGTVARVSVLPTGERVVTLDNGQVWMLTEVTMKGPLLTGERVMIREAAMGSHLLLTPKNIALRARRVQ